MRFRLSLFFLMFSTAIWGADLSETIQSQILFDHSVLDDNTLFHLYSNGFIELHQLSDFLTGTEPPGLPVDSLAALTLSARKMEPERYKQWQDALSDNDRKLLKKQPEYSLTVDAKLPARLLGQVRHLIPETTVSSFLSSRNLNVTDTGQFLSLLNYLSASERHMEAFLPWILELHNPLLTRLYSGMIKPDPAAVTPLKLARTPKHVAVIMDGNNRWARMNNLSSYAGYLAGLSSLRDAISVALAQDIKVLSFYAFSRHNWKRPAEMISLLMQMNLKIAEDRDNIFNELGIRVLFLGERTAFSEQLQQAINHLEQRTRHETRLTLVIANNYTSRWDILRAAQQTQPGELLTEELFSSRLSTAGLPDPDLLIRTSGEQRLSDFLLWEMAHTEFYFPKKHWPDFDINDMQNALRVYNSRDRRFGQSSAVTQGK